MSNLTAICHLPRQGMDQGILMININELILQSAIATYKLYMATSLSTHYLHSLLLNRFMGLHPFQEASPHQECAVKPVWNSKLRLSNMNSME